MTPTTFTVLSTEAMKGRHVLGREGEDLGKIQHVMIDLSAGRVAYAVMSFGGFLGIGARMVAIPWGALHASNRSDDYVVDLSKDRIREAPSFGKDKWPGGADRSFLSSLYSYYGYMPYWEIDEEQEKEHDRIARDVEMRNVETMDEEPAQPARATIVESTIIETTITEYETLGEVGGIGGEDLSAGMGTAGAYDEHRGTNASDDMGGVLSDTDMTDERWRSPRNENVSGMRRSDLCGMESNDDARGFEDLDPGSEVAFGTTSGDTNRYADTTGADEPMDAGIPASDFVPEAQGNMRAFEGQDEEGLGRAYGPSSGYADVSGLDSPDDLTIGSVDDLNTIGSTLGLEGTSLEDEYADLPGEGTRRGSSASGDFRTNEEDDSEGERRTFRSGRGHSGGQTQSTHEGSSLEEEEDEKNKSEG